MNRKRLEQTKISAVARKHNLKELQSLTPLQQRIVGIRDYTGRLARRVAVIAPRRSGKSFGLLIFAGWFAKTNPHANIAFITKQKNKAHEIGFLPFQKKLKPLFNWDCEFNINNQSASFPNGSRIVFFGADTEQAWEGFRGGLAYDIIIIDEVAQFLGDTFEKIFWTEILEPTLLEKKGRIFLISTPGSTPNSMFYRIYAAKNGLNPVDSYKDWTLLQAPVFANPYTADQMKEGLTEKIKLNPGFDKTASYKREYLGEFVLEDSSLVYQIKEEANFLYEWKKDKHDQYLLGIDWGLSSPSSFVLCCFNKKKNNQFVVLEDFYKERLSQNEIALKIKHYLAKYHPLTIITDNNDQHLNAWLRKEHGINTKFAEKVDKSSAIELFNAEAELGKVQFFNLKEPANPEMMDVVLNIYQLTWQYKKTGKRYEHGANHLTDSLLYAFRYSKHNLFKEDVPTPEEGTPEWFDWQAAQRRETRLKRTTKSFQRRRDTRKQKRFIT